MSDVFTRDKHSLAHYSNHGLIGTLRMEPESKSLALMLGKNETIVNELLFQRTLSNYESDWLTMCFCQHVGKGWGEDWSGVIFRKEFKSLKDLGKKVKEYISKAFPDCRILKNGLEYRFATGEVLILDCMKTLKQYDIKYHGHNLQYIGWDELATWQDDELYEAMISTCRTSFIPTKSQPLMPPCQIRAATKPYGCGKNWVYKRFVKDVKAGEIFFSNHSQDE